MMPVNCRLQWFTLRIERNLLDLLGDIRMLSSFWTLVWNCKRHFSDFPVIVKDAKSMDAHAGG